MGKQRKGEKCPDTGETRTRDSGSGGSSLNHQTTSTLCNATHELGECNKIFNEGERVVM